MTTYQSMIENILSLTEDKQEVISSFESYKNYGIGLTAGFVEERLQYDFKWNSKELKMLNKIIKESYKYHELNEELEYANEENEHQ